MPCSRRTQTGSGCLAHHDGDLVAATTWVRVGRHVWYSYGASSSAKRDVRGSNAVQWQMIRDAIDAGAGVRPARHHRDARPQRSARRTHPVQGRHRRQEPVAYVGEWDLPLNKFVYKAFDLYMNRR